MEVYTLDSVLRRDRVIDSFESLIWTERFSSYGDFELTIRSTNEGRSLLQPGVQLAMNESYRVMTVENITNSTNEDGLRVLKVTGNSLESCLEDRVAKNSTANLTTSPTWDLTGVPAVVARKIFHDICVTGILSPYDKIPFVVEGNGLMPSSTIPEPVDPITLKLPPQSVYQAIKEICDVWYLGFRLLRNFDQSQLYWDVYSGSNRTTRQTVRPPVVFAPNLDNLTNTSEFNTIEAAKNVAYVYAPNGFQMVYPQDVPPDIDGFDRRVLHVDASDITLAAGSALDAALLQRGKEQLAQNRSFQAFDGEISQYSQYRYQRDYFLGDLVEMRNDDGVANDMRVTEQIFVSDKEGDRSYPTLTLNTYIGTGSWLSWESNKTWLDLDADPITWSELP